VRDVALKILSEAIAVRVKGAFAAAMEALADAGDEVILARLCWSGFYPAIKRVGI